VIQRKITNSFAPINLIDDDSGIVFVLFLFTSNTKREVCDVLDSFLSFFKKIEERKAHDMLFLMLDPRFKSLCLVSFILG
jgi:hypothetical protein